MAAQFSLKYNKNYNNHKREEKIENSLNWAQQQLLKRRSPHSVFGCADPAKRLQIVKH